MNEKDLVAAARILANTDSEWNWYTLDRALAQQPTSEWVNVVEAVEALARQGLVTMLPSGNPAMPIYRLTDLGQKWLQNRD